MLVRTVAGIFLAALMSVPAVSIAQDTTDNSTQTATGCLKKGASSRIYLLTDENGKLWNLSSPSVGLDRHVGQSVTVKGTIPKESKNSSDTAPQNRLLVTKLDMVRDNCKQP